MRIADENRARQILIDARREFLKDGRRPYTASCGAALWDSALGVVGDSYRVFGLILEKDESLGEWDVVVHEISDEEAMSQVAAWLMKMPESQLKFFVGALAWEYVRDPDAKFWRVVEKLRSQLKESRFE